MTQKFKTKKISKQTNKKNFFPDFKGILCSREGIEKKKQDCKRNKKDWKGVDRQVFKRIIEIKQKQLFVTTLRYHGIVN